MTGTKLAARSAGIALVVVSMAVTWRLLSSILGRRGQQHTNAPKRDRFEISEQGMANYPRGTLDAQAPNIDPPAQIGEDLRASGLTELDPAVQSADYPPPSVAGDRVDEASWQSFPASDAPPWR